MAYLVFCIINVIIGGRNCVYSSSSSSSNTEPYPNPQRDRNDGSSSSDPPSCRTTHSCGSCLLPTNEEDNAPFTLYRHPSSSPAPSAPPTARLLIGMCNPMGRQQVQELGQVQVLLTAVAIDFDSLPSAWSSGSGAEG